MYFIVTINNFPRWVLNSSLIDIRLRIVHDFLICQVYINYIHYGRFSSGFSIVYNAISIFFSSTQRFPKPPGCYFIIFVDNIRLRIVYFPRELETAMLKYVVYVILFVAYISCKKIVILSFYYCRFELNKTVYSK